MKQDEFNTLRQVKNEPQSSQRKLAKDLGNLEIESRSETFLGWTLYVDRHHFFIEPSWLEFKSIPERLLKLPLSL